MENGKKKREKKKKKEKDKGKEIVYNARCARVRDSFGAGQVARLRRINPLRSLEHQSSGAAAIMALDCLPLLAAQARRRSACRYKYNDTL